MNKAEAARNQKAEAAYRSIQDMGTSGAHPALERFSVASGSTAGVHYTVSHDMQGDRYHCDCPAGIHERACVHVSAVRRLVSERRTAWATVQDPIWQANFTARQVERDTSIRRMKPFSLMA